MRLSAEHVATLEKAFASGDVEQVLATWRETRAGAIGDALRGAGPEAPKLPRGSERFLGAWTDAWRTSSEWERGGLIGPLMDVGPRLTHRMAKALFRYLAEQPADPRLGTALAHVAKEQPASFEHATVLQAFRGAVLTHADTRHVRLLEALRPGATRTEQKRFDATLKALAQAAEAAPATKHLGSLKLGTPPNRGAKARSVDELLWTLVYEQPGDLQSRAVLADALQSAGDPRGEFIANQLAGVGGPPSPEVAKAMLGPLAAALVLDTVTFENGFPVTGRLQKMSTPRQQVIVQHREWATFRRVEGLMRLSPTFRSLESTGAAITNGKGLAEWISRKWPLPIREVAISVDAIAELRNLPTAPESVHLSLILDDVDIDDVVEDLASMPTVRRVFFGAPMASTGEEWPRWPSPKPLERAAHLESLGWDCDDFDVFVERTGARFDTVRYVARDGVTGRLRSLEAAVKPKHIIRS